METFTVDIPVEDFAEYQQLLKARQIIVDKIDNDGGISVLDLLSALGGANAIQMYQRLRKELKSKIREDKDEREGIDEPY